MQLNAYAKINLTLDVLNKRPNGYHSIDSVMQSVSLCDTVSVEKARDITLSCDNGEINGSDNIAFKAALNFFEFTGIKSGAEIVIKKNIPLAAGLGGGSSDAAAVIRCLDAVYKTNLSDKELTEIALSVGADVVFCLFGKTARVGGIGEIITPLKPLKDYFVVLIKDGNKESTAQMYKCIDRAQKRKPMTELFVNELSSGNLPFGFVGNDFLAVSSHEKTLAVMNSMEPLCSSLSGSGPTVFSVFKEEKSAVIAAESLEKSGYKPMICKFI